jgi:DNA polymerase-4
MALGLRQPRRWRVSASKPSSASGRKAAFLLQHLGKAGIYYYWAARGVDERSVRADRIRESVGAENTLSTISRSASRVAS